MRFALFVTIALFVSPPASARADVSASHTPKPVPATRPEMKQALEDLKQRSPRLPTPPTDSRGGVINGRMRAYYLPASWNNRGGGRNSAATLDYVLTTSMFWVVSRGNNCHYCLGHQELKLRGAGVDEDLIAALDSDWSRYDPRMHAALAFARRLTLEPQLVDDKDIAQLKEHFTDAEILELTFVASRFNATNRWTDGLGLPQDDHFRDRDSNLLSPTSADFQNAQSIVTPDTRAPRGELPSLEDADRAIVACRQRSARVALPDEAQARAALGDAASEGPLPAWKRAMAAVKGSGRAQVEAWDQILSDDNLSPRLKAELALVTAVHNRAWYAAAHAATRLANLGVSTDELHAVFTGEEQSPAVNAAHRLAAKLTISPHLITDADVDALRRHFSDRETAQIVHVVCMANLFDRFTGALGLPLEERMVPGNALAE